MYTKQIMLFLICFEAAHLQKSYLKKILKSENNFFHIINTKIHVMSNKLFNSLKLSKEFGESTNVLPLLTMHYDLNRISERNSRAYHEIRNASAANHNKTDNNPLKEIMKDIVKEEINEVRINKTNSTLGNNNSTNHRSEDGLDMFSEFWSTIENIIDPVIDNFNAQQKEISRKFTRNKSRHARRQTPKKSSIKDPSTNNTRRIYKGRKSKLGNYPFMASLHIANDFICAGSIISKDLVLTAASCLQMAYTNKMHLDKSRALVVRIGSDYTRHAGEVVPVTEVIFHPKYDPVTLKNNLAIIRLMKQIRFTKKCKIKRINYDRGASLPQDVREVTILGWGAKDALDESNNNLQPLAVAHLNVYSLESCKDVYSRHYVNEQNFCAGFVTKGGGACNGDVGGPALASGQLIGVISFGPSVCGTPDAPTVFTRVGHYAEWIDSIVKNETGIKHVTSGATTLHIIKARLPKFTTTPQALPVTHNMLQTNRYSEEMLVLRKIIQEILLANSSVVDYLLAGDILGDESIDTSHAEAILRNLGPDLEGDTDDMQYSESTDEVTNIIGINKEQESNFTEINDVDLATMIENEFEKRLNEFSKTNRHLSDYDIEKKTTMKQTISSKSSENNSDNIKSLLDSSYSEEISIETTSGPVLANNLSRAYDMLSKKQFKSSSRKPDNALKGVKSLNVINTELNKSIMMKTAQQHKSELSKKQTTKGRLKKKELETYKEKIFNKPNQISYNYLPKAKDFIRLASKGQNIGQIINRNLNNWGPGITMVIPEIASDYYDDGQLMRYTDQ